MAETKGKGMKVVLSDSEGLMSGWLSSSAELAEKTVATSFDVLRDLRTEVHARFLATVDWVDTSQQSVARLARGLGNRIDGLVEQALETGEGMTVGAVRTTRDVVQELTGLASRTSAAVTSRPEYRAQRAA
jgi:hypothetical protein